MAALNAALDTATHLAPCFPLLSQPLMSYQFGAARPDRGHHALPPLAEGKGVEPSTACTAPDFESEEDAFLQVFTGQRVTNVDALGMHSQLALGAVSLF